MSRTDFELVLAWLRAPHVSRWWGPPPRDLDAIEEEYGKAVDGIEPTEVFVVHVEGRPVGMIQRYRVAADPAWVSALSVVTDPTDAAGIDYFLGDESMIGRGIGAAMIEAFVHGLFEVWPDVQQVLVDPQQDNEASWRVLERVGFVRRWSGRIEYDDPANVGPAHVYRLARP